MSLARSAVRPAPRRGLSRIEAADYIGVSPSKFDEMIKDQRMPGPVHIDNRKVWDVREIDLAFDELPRDDAEKDRSWEEFDAR